MDTQKLITVVVWATIVFVAYEAYRSITASGGPPAASDIANLLDPNSSANSAETNLNETEIAVNPSILDTLPDNNLFADPYASGFLL